MFKKIIFAAALLVLISKSIATAEHKTKPDINSQFNGMYWSQLPVICGTNDRVEAYLKHYNFKLESVSMGRESAQPDGAPVYIVSYYINKEKSQTISVVSTPTGTESCMLYKSFDLVYYDGENT